MKTFAQVMLALALLFVATIGYSNLRAQWEKEERVARIDRAIEERKARLASEIAYRNQFADQTIKQALQSESEAQARWDSAKDRGKLPGDNTTPGFTSANANRNYAAPRINR
jgi:hypothetical protein